ncbi:YeeE/YedE family protein [Pseudobacteriovorax antillogorgiicola]|uniref:Uncharacterized protein n=1 Tax=Pseudobacteriovorax antillogorgiicola TaxID=1513793 RepID=A0A1Y6BSR0_9BACT|nr:YeeE/YedE thiosulfate transporter family protein [Pseudobacteriovorax antillogorgiicola]TCS54706.1 hypothetical protein EDD56_106219 [Pseudobacteriovorax antillogorgiicola]SMF16254.1 hypothetical protein SAMN06296036_10624 [Pseudobacteriovorax antillogorgiicola]
MNEYLMALLGGGLIGLSASLFLLFKGRVFGVSGILAAWVAPQKHDFVWKSVVILGLIAGGVLVSFILPERMPNESSQIPTMAKVGLAGILVGFGTQLGSGCTSGHGVCGMSRFSIRSLIATLCFMGAGIVTVALAN